jgi:hypothetical protein
VARRHGMTPNECTVVREGMAHKDLGARRGCVAWLVHGANLRDDITEVFELLRYQEIPTIRMEDVHL